MVHFYKLGGFNVVLDVFSGGIHIVDDLAYDVVSNYEKGDENFVVGLLKDKYAEKEIRECYSQVGELKKQGKLFSPDLYEGLSGTLKEKNDGIVKALCLHVAHTCNLNCEYCFATSKLIIALSP